MTLIAMKNRMIFQTALFIFLFTLTYTSFAEKRTFKIGINDQDNFPSMVRPGTENDPNPGIMIEGMRYIAKETSIDVVYIRLPWKRCLKALKAGEMDGLICGSYKKDREIYGAFPKTPDGKIDPQRRFLDSSYYLYVKKDSSLSWDGINFSRKDIRIGAELGFSIVPVLKSMGVQVEELDSVRVNFIKLLTGRLDGVAAHESSGDVIMLFSSEIRKMEVPLKSKAYYLMISRKFLESDRELSEKIWDACSKLQKKEMGIIKKRYSGKKSWEEMR